VGFDLISTYNIHSYLSSIHNSQHKTRW